jgi:hypothetical protein
MGEAEREQDLFIKPRVLAEPKTLSPAPVGSRPAHRNLADEAIRWAEGHPEEMEILYETAEEMVAARQHFGIGYLWEVLRYKWLRRGNKERPVLNNSHRAYVARYMIAKRPNLEQWMEFRAVAYTESPKERSA